MKQFKVYENELTKQLEAVKQGWSWPAFFFGWIWAFWDKNWKIGGIFLVIWLLTLGLSPSGNEILAIISLVISIAVWIILGMKGNEFRETNLIQRGFVYRDIIVAVSKAAATTHYLTKK